MVPPVTSGPRRASATHPTRLVTRTEESWPFASRRGPEEPRRRSESERARGRAPVRERCLGESGFRRGASRFLPPPSRARFRRRLPSSSRRPFPLFPRPFRVENSPRFSRRREMTRWLGRLWRGENSRGSVDVCGVQPQTFLPPPTGEIPRLELVTIYVVEFRRCARAHHPRVGNFFLRVRLGRLWRSERPGTRKMAIHARSG